MTIRQRQYPIPDTRLPFVNGQIAELEFRGRPHLMSATWSGPAGVKFCIWDPVSGESHVRSLPRVPGCYMIKRGPDCRLYLGCGNGDLYRYDPVADAFEPLVTDVMHSITWGGCVTDRHVVWSASPGEAAVYDWQDGKLIKVFKPLDSEQPTALYGHNIVAAPDGQVVAFLSVPRCRLFLIDPANGTVVTYSPPELADARWITQAAFLDDRTLAALVDAPKPFTLLLDYPSLRVRQTLPVPESPIPTNQRAAFLNGQWHAWFGLQGSLYRFDISAGKWEVVHKNFLDDRGGILGPFADRFIVALQPDGRTLNWDSQTNQTSEQQLEVWGPLEAHAMCIVPQRNLILGAPFINRRFWTINLATGQGQDRGPAQPGGGQINQVVWDDVRHKALLSSYTWSALSEYDPAKEGHWPDNPRLIAFAKDEEQMRPRALVFDGRYAWMGTSSAYGTLGGALIRFDPQSNSRQVWRHIVRDQIINTLVLDLPNRRLYGASEIYADCESCPPTRTTAEVFAFDIDTMQVAHRSILREGAPAANVLCLLPEGVLVYDGVSLFRWEPERHTLTRIGPAPQGIKQVLLDESGTLWGLAQGGIGLLTFSEGAVRFTLKIPEARKILRFQITGDTMYYPAGTAVHAVDLKSL